ncbi:MAG: aldehyde dehydrogenase family protein [Candidatus Dormibacteraeota bacterium]|nr:aldehyde dehydrogenase family protein [Candidatus Dormibacteraeota bacterium]
MAVTQKSTETTAKPEGETFQSLHPATGEVVGTYPIMGKAEVQAAVDRARDAFQWWQSIGWEGRKKKLNAFKGEIARNLEELSRLIHEENGKPYADAFLECVMSIEHLSWAAGHAKKTLGRRSVSPGMLLINHAAYLEYQAFGVIGVIGPWNYPVFTPMGSIAYALAAGNAVVFKPSEYTPAVAKWLEAACARAIPEAPVFQVITGLGATGGALCASGVNKIAFTGSAPTGKKVMGACAETLTPVLMELGGKDALIVTDDANVEEAATAAVWGGLQNAGQACISVERVYATEGVYDELVERIIEIAGRVKAGSDEDSDIGPITMPRQRDIIAAHLDDAFKRGARAVVGGPDAVHGAFVDPVVLVDVPEDSDAIQKETFGPTLPVTKVRDVDEAIEKANGTPYGLASTVFARKRALEIASRLRAGMTSINSAAAYAGVAALPFGGVGDSGFGRIHGEDGLREFTRAHAITKKRFNTPLDIMKFDRNPNLIPRVTKLIKLVHGRG